MTRYRTTRDFPNIGRQRFSLGYGPNITLPSSELSNEELRTRLKKDASKFLAHISYDQNAPQGELRDDVFEQWTIEELCDRDFVGISRIWREKF